jgi:Transposase DDE domain
MERELWKLLYLVARKLDNPWGSWRYSRAEVLAVYFWAVVHDRPTSWATDRAEWPDDLRPTWLPPQSTLSRRLRQPQTVELMTAVEQHLLAILALGRYLVKRIDSKALAVSKVSKDPDTGYGRGAGGMQKGYKLHIVWSRGPMPLAWGLAPMNVGEKTMARGLIPSLPGGGYLLGDTHYDANDLYDLAAEAGFQLVAKKTKSRGPGGLGHRRQSPGRLRSIELLNTVFGRALFNQRNAIEGHFSTLTCIAGGLAPLPAWVRRFHRVRNWVQAKIITAGARWLLLYGSPQLALA